MKISKYTNFPYQEVYAKLNIMGNFIKKVRLEWFIDELVRKQDYFCMVDDDKPRFIESNHYYIPSSEFQHILGAHEFKQEVIKVLTEMTVLSVIELPTSYFQYNSPLGYKLKINPGYPKSKKIHNKKIEGSFKKLWSDRTDPIKKSGLSGICRRLCKLDFNITEEQFRLICNKRYPDYIMEKMELGLDFKSKIDYVESQMSQYRRILRWNSSNQKERMAYYFKVCEFGHRLHSIFSTSMKDLRAYVTFEENYIDCVEADMDCSQFNIFANLLAAQGIKDEYVDIISTDNFHSAVARKMRIERWQAKLMNYKLMFCKINNKAHKDFVSMFPVAGEELTKLKSTIYKGLPVKCHTKTIKDSKTGQAKLDKNGNKIKVNTYHKSASCKLQQEESKIMKEVWLELQRRKIKFLPVHDAVYIEKARSEEGIAVFNFILSQHLEFFNVSTTNTKREF
jgi:hypothetical protein